MRRPGCAIDPSVEGLAGGVHGPDDGDAASARRQDGGVAAVSCAPFPVGEGVASGEAESQGRRLVDDAFARPGSAQGAAEVVAALRAAAGPGPEARPQGLPAPGGRWRRSRRAVAAGIAGVHDPLHRQDAAHRRQAPHASRLGAGRERFAGVAVSPSAGGACLGGELPAKPRPGRGTRHVRRLGLCDGLLDRLPHATQMRGPRPALPCEACGDGGAQVLRRGGKAENGRPGPAGPVDPLRQRRKERGRQASRPGAATGLVLHDPTATAGQPADSDLDPVLGIDSTQVMAGSGPRGAGGDLQGAGAVLAATDPLTRPAHGKAGRMDAPEAGCRDLADSCRVAAGIAACAPAEDGPRIRVTWAGPMPLLRHSAPHRHLHAPAPSHGAPGSLRLPPAPGGMAVPRQAWSGRSTAGFCPAGHRGRPARQPFAILCQDTGSHQRADPGGKMS